MAGVEAMSSASAPPVPNKPTRAKDGPSWAKDVKDLPAPARRLIERYSGVGPDEVVPHALAIRDKAWAIAPYGCVGMMGFSFPTVQQHPQYDALLRRLGESTETAFLDLGCGLGQNMRQLALDSAPQAQLTGADLSPGLVDCGYEYFGDSRSLASAFLIGDVFDADGDIGRSAQGRFDVVWAAMFYHLWDWDGQVEASVATTRLLKSRPGAMIMGWQVGASPSQEYCRPVSVTGRMEQKHRVMFQHDEESMRRMWAEIGRITGEEWKVEVATDVPEWYSSLPSMFGNSNVNRVTFTIVRGG